MSSLPAPNGDPCSQPELAANGQVEPDGHLPNPFSGVNSGYGHMVDSTFVSAYPEGSEMYTFHQDAHRYVADLVLDKNVDIAAGDRRFPCVFGQAAFRTEQYAFSAYDDITDPETIEAVLHDIIQGQHEFDIPASPPRTSRFFRSTLVAFKHPEIQDELDGARALYNLMGSMHELNAKYYDWPENYSNDINSAEFGFGIGETAHFIAFFHPHASVPSRRSDVQFVVFNSHDVVYEYKHAKGMVQHAKKRAEIRRRQVQPIHPALGDHGATPDWPQYALLTPDTATEAKERVLRQAILGECPFKPSQERQPEPTMQEDYESE